MANIMAESTKNRFLMVRKPINNHCKWRQLVPGSLFYQQMNIISPITFSQTQDQVIHALDMSIQL